jgi:4-amino-4-deoxy-L-arabinose transferase-like glycosyltransferase
LAVRVAVRWRSGAPDFWENGYTFFFLLAENIAVGNGIAFDGRPPTAFRVPLYPLFLAAVTLGHRAFVPIVLAQSLIGTATAWCSAVLTRELFGNTAAIIAALLTALYPYYVVHDTALQETSLYTFLMALSVLLLLRVRRSGSVSMAISAGLTLGAAVLTRANLAPMVLLGPLWLALAGGPGAARWRQRLWAAAICAGVSAILLSSWLVRSYSLTGSATLSTQTGFFLWLGNNPYTFSHYPRDSIDRSQETALAALSSQERQELRELNSNEAIEDGWFRREGIEYIGAHPWQTFVNGFRKLAAAFCLLPSPRRSFWPNLVYLLSYGPMMALGLTGMWVGRRHWREHSIFYALFIAFAIVTAVFFGHTSYRAYLDVYWIVFAAGILALLRAKYFQGGIYNVIKFRSQQVASWFGGKRYRSAQQD